MTFLHKRVEEGNGTFGSHLRDLRELQNIPISRAMRDTKIRDTILLAFEEDRIADLDDPVFAERHLVAYVRYLGGHEPYFLARYRERLKDLHAERTVRDLLPRMRGVRGLDLFVGPQLIGLAGVLLLGTAFAGYVLWQAHLVRIPPPLEVETPSDGVRLEHPTVTVRGHTMAEAIVTVNGRDAAVDASGNFAHSLDVRRGTTVITIVASRRRSPASGTTERGSQTIVERRVTYDAALSDGETFSLPTTTSTTSTPATP